jgi:integrase
MPKVARPLTARQVENNPPGVYADGHGLYLNVTASRSRSWLLRYMMGGKRREMGLGPFPVVTLQQARDAAIDLQRLIRTGVDPIDQKRGDVHATKLSRIKRQSFREAAEAYIQRHEHQWRDKRSWPQSLEYLVYPEIGDLPVATIGTPEVLRVLQPIWLSKAVTATRVRGRIENILDFATAGGFRPEGVNPARWSGHMQLLLGKQAIAPVSHAAVDYKAMRPLMATLADMQDIPAKALRFTVLTAARAGEVLKATWGEIDAEAAVWRVPASHMKAKREHVVPLSRAALAVLNEVSNYRGPDGRIFPGEYAAIMPSSSMKNLLDKVSPGAHTHGLRASFRTWCSDSRQDRDLSEMSLAHRVGNDVERRYARSELIELRRGLMEEWAKHATG